MPSTRQPLLPALATLALALLAVTACRPAAREALASDGGYGTAAAGTVGRDAIAPRSGGGPLPQDEDALALPIDFPDDVYLPPHYRIDSVMDRGGLRVVSLQAPGRVSGLFGAASAAMRARGWTQTLAMQESGDSAVLTYEKDRRAAVLSFNGGGGLRGVTMNVQLRNDAL